MVKFQANAVTYGFIHCEVMGSLVETGGYTFWCNATKIEVCSPILPIQCLH